MSNEQIVNGKCSCLLDVALLRPAAAQITRRNQQPSCCQMIRYVNIDNNYVCVCVCVCARVCMLYLDPATVDPGVPDPADGPVRGADHGVRGLGVEQQAHQEETPEQGVSRHHRARA